MRAPRSAIVAVSALLLLGCGSGADAPAKTTAAKKKKPARPVLCGRLKATVTGHVGAPDAKELSGLVFSRTQANVLWTHNDSGDTARVFAIDTAGKLLAQLAVPGAENVDWEDIAVGPAGDIYAADIGDNLAKRASVVVYRVPEPKVTGAAPAQTGPPARYELRYPDGARDAEALLVDPTTGALTIVSKSFGGTAGIYTTAKPSATGPTTLTKAGTLSLGIGEAVTAGDVSADGRTVALRTYDRAFVWSKTATASVPATLRRRSCSPAVSLLNEGQGEALALSRHGTSFFTVPEGENPALRRYAPAR